MDNRSREENAYFAMTLITSTLGYIIYIYLRVYKEENRSLGSIIFGGEFLNNIKSILFLSMILSLITPVLGSLTVAYSDETIILDYGVLVFVHLIYYDFEMIAKEPQNEMTLMKHSSGAVVD